MNIQEGFERIAEQEVVGAAFCDALGLLTVCFQNDVAMYVRIEDGRLLVEFEGPTIQ